MFSYTVYFLYCSLSISFTFTNKSTSLKCWVHVWDCRVISNIKILTALWFQRMHELIKHLPWLNTMQVALFRSICQMHKSTAYLDGKMLGEKQHMWEKKNKGSDYFIGACSTYNCVLWFILNFMTWFKIYGFISTCVTR